jgi:hypothetical protein
MTEHESVTYKLVCDECGEECEKREITYHYSGTHCTHGESGVHHTGDYESVCCGADYHES